VVIAVVEKKPATKKPATKKKVVESRPVGKPTILNPELQDKIVELIRLGNYASDAAGACGISKGTFFNWCARGKDEAERRRLLPDAKLLPNEVKYLEFLDAVEKARDEATVRNVSIIQRAGHDGTWQAAAWWLERTRQNTYGRKERLEVTGQDGEAMKISVDMGELEEKIAQVIAIRRKHLEIEE
jgi:hypothetical protein